MKRIFEVRYSDKTIPMVTCNNGSKEPAYLKKIIGRAEEIEIEHLINNCHKFKVLNVKSIILH